MAKNSNKPGVPRAQPNTSQSEGATPAAVESAAGAVPDASATQTTVSAPVVSQEASAASPPPTPKAHTHRVNWTLHRNKKRYLEGSTIALSDEEAQKLGAVVSKL